MDISLSEDVSVQEHSQAYRPNFFVAVAMYTVTVLTRSVRPELVFQLGAEIAPLTHAIVVSLTATLVCLR